MLDKFNVFRINEKRFLILLIKLVNIVTTLLIYSNLAYKSIVVNFQQAGGIYELSVKDNGIPFETDTLINLGKHRITTHADTGGSGIGFMTTFDIMRSCSASLIITENDFYKIVAVRFDGKSRYIVHSHGAERIMEKK